jgi:hypothetical protein
MLRMVLVGLLIPLGVGVLAAMELRTPPRTAVTVVQPLAETTVGISDSHGALAKADRLEITYAKSETPAQPGLVDERISPSEATTIGSSEAPRIINPIGTIPNQRRSLPLPFLSRSQRPPILSALPFPSVQRPPATPSPVG